MLGFGIECFFFLMWLRYRRMREVGKLGRMRCEHEKSPCRRLLYFCGRVRGEERRKDVKEVQKSEKKGERRKNESSARQTDRQGPWGFLSVATLVHTRASLDVILTSAEATHSQTAKINIFICFILAQGLLGAIGWFRWSRWVVVLLAIPQFCNLAGQGISKLLATDLRHRLGKYISSLIFRSVTS